MQCLVCSMYFDKSRAYGIKKYENSLLLWDIHHGADILVFAPVGLISVVIIDIFYHLGSISFIYSVCEKTLFV